MSNLATKVVRSEAYAEAARVVAAPSGGACVVELGLERVTARRAAGCLLAPAEGDRVLVAWADETCWVLTVLERAEPERRAWIESDGELGVRARHSSLTLAAQEGIALATPATVAVTARAVDVKADETSFVAARMRWAAERLDAEAARVELVLGKVHSVAERLYQRLGRCYRFVKELDQVRAGQLEYRAEGYARVHAADTVVTAEKLLKMDGAQIHMG